MKHHLLRILIILFFSIGHSTNSNDYSYLDSYFFQLKTLDYPQARSAALKAEDLLLQSELKLLTNILYYSSEYEGRKPIEIQLSDNANPFLLSINHLNLGYYDFYLVPDKSRVYSHFYSALQNAYKSDYKPLIKRCLLALLEYYHYEIAQSNLNFADYLNEYQNLKEDNIDAIWITIYQLIFLSSTITELNDEYYTIAKQLDTFLATLPKNSLLLPKIYFEKALSYELSKDFEKAKDYYLKAFSESKDLPFYKYLRSSCTYKLSFLLHKQGKHREALEKLYSAQKYANTRDTLFSSYYLNIYKAMYFEGLKQFDSAYIALEKVNIAEYHLEFRKNTLEAARLKVELETKEKEEQLEEQKQAIVKNRNYLLAAIGLLIIGSLMAVLIQKSTKRKQRIAEQEKELEKQKVSTLLKEQELTAIDAMIEGQEKERQRIADDLHDDLGGLMATLKLHFNALKEKPDSEMFDKTSDLLDQAYSKIRSVAHTKNSGVMANKGLLKALHDMANTISATNKLQVEIVDHGLDNRLENSLELTIFRIIQELITNTIKHANATETMVHITKHDDSLNIMVEDNGKGFNTKNIAKKSGMGIHSIDKRIENLGGNVTIESEINKGTTVIIDIPS